MPISKGIAAVRRRLSMMDRKENSREGQFSIQPVGLERLLHIWMIDNVFLRFFFSFQISN